MADAGRAGDRPGSEYQGGRRTPAGAGGGERDGSKQRGPRQIPHRNEKVQTMITKVVLAKLSPTMEEGTIVKWNKKEGDAVKQGDVLAEIETDKANMEMEALGSGVLRKVLVPAGGKAPAGALSRRSVASP